MADSGARVLGFAADPELQAALAVHALSGLTRLLAYVPAGEALESAEMGALVRLIDQAASLGGRG